MNTFCEINLEPQTLTQGMVSEARSFEPRKSRPETLQGYLAHKKRLPVGPYSRPMPVALMVLFHPVGCDASTHPRVRRWPFDRSMAALLQMFLR